LEWLLLRTQTTKIEEDAGEKGTLIHFWWKVQPLWKIAWRHLKKLKTELPYDPAIPLLGIYPKDHESGYNKGTCTPMFIAALFIIVKLWKQPRCPLLMNGLRKCIYTQWNFSQPQRMKFCHLQVNGWKWRTSP
jgi:hypothetical protein